MTTIYSNVTYGKLFSLPFFGQVKLTHIMTNEFSHHYHLGKPTFIFRGIRSDFTWSGNLFLIAPFPDRCLLACIFLNFIQVLDGNSLSKHVTSGAMLFAYVP